MWKLLVATPGSGVELGSIAKMAWANELTSFFSLPPTHSTFRLVNLSFLSLSFLMLETPAWLGKGRVREQGGTVIAVAPAELHRHDSEDAKRVRHEMRWV